MSTLRANEIVMLDGIGKATATFDSVQDMKDSAYLRTGQKVRTLGYYSPGDGGGNDYEVVAAATGTNDGGSFIDLSGSGLQAKGLFTHGRVCLKQFGFTGSGDEGPVFNKALALCSVDNLTLELLYITLLTDGPHTIPAGLNIECHSTTIQRFTSGYTGTDPLLIVESNVRISGDLTVDGNDPDEAGVQEDSFPSVLVTGDDVYIESLTCNNTPMFTEGGKQLRGCSVTGDNFHCGSISGDRVGYALLQLDILKDMKLFQVDKFGCTNFHYRGFQVNGSNTFVIDDIVFGSMFAETPPEFAHNASNPFLIDTSADNSLIQVKNCSINYAHFIGGNNNGSKIQNTEHYYCGALILDIKQNYPGYALSMHAKNCHIDFLVYNDKAVNLYSASSYFGEVRAEHSDDFSETDMFGFRDRTSENEFSGPRFHTINKMHVVNNPSCAHVFRLDHKNVTDLNIVIGEVITPDARIFGHFDKPTGGPNAIRDGRILISKVTGLVSTNILTSDREFSKWIQIGNRVFGSMDGVPATGIYRQGDYVKNLEPAVISGTPDYIIKGWICTIGGDEATFNFEEDRLTL